PVRTEVRTADGWLDFQDWFVRRHHADDALEIRYAGVDRARPTAEVMDEVAAADLIVLAPSNPFVSIGTILAVPGLLETLMVSPAPRVAVSPIVAGTALRGPAATMMSSLAGLDATATGVAGYYADRYPGLIQTMVIDESDRAETQAIEAFGHGVLVAPTILTSEVEREALARAIIEAFPVAR
ncbi:MAG: YvcK family protein, partial [Chloroflexi bacterium]|nr:YvcK family protein [Chloroflexota bacterium]